MALAALWDRVHSVHWGGAEIRLHQQLLREAKVADQGGDAQRAEELRAAADLLLSKSRSIGAEYEAIRARNEPGWERTKQLGRQVEEARDLATKLHPSREQVADLFRSGRPGDRITALAFIQAAPETADLKLLLEAVTNRHSRFEQYHSLLALKAVVQQDEGDLGTLETVLRSVEQLDFRPGSDRARLARDITGHIHRLLKSPPAEP